MSIIHGTWTTTATNNSAYLSVFRKTYTKLVSIYVTSKDDLINRIYRRRYVVGTIRNAAVDLNASRIDDRLSSSSLTRMGHLTR